MKNKITDIAIITSNELTSGTFELPTDVIEFGLDQFMKNGIAKEFPILNAVASAYNITASYVNKNNAKKILVFLQEFNSGNFDEIKFNQFVHKMRTNQNYRDEVVETIILLNERFLKTEKSKILANLVVAHVNGKLSWPEFSDIAYILELVHPKCFYLLKEMANQPYWRSQIIQHPADEALIIAAGIGHREGNSFAIVDLGQKLHDFGLAPSGL
jgi:hypothetical protein